MSTAPAEAFEAFREMVSRDAALEAELLDIADDDEFASAVVAAGVARGFQFDADDVRRAMRDGRRVWLERWIT